MSAEHPIVWDDTKVARLWDFYARTKPFSDAYFSKAFGARILRKSGIPLTKSLAVLDYGSGPGFMWEYIRKLNVAWDYTGLDFSLDSVQQLTKKAGDHPRFKGAVFVRQLPSELPADHFDAVLLCEVVEHLNDEHLSGTLDEIRRVLRPGGTLVVTTPNDEDLTLTLKFCPECSCVFHQWQHVRTWSATTLTAYMEQRGFAMQFVKTVDFSKHGALRKILGKVRRIASGQHKRPHLIASFRKDR